MNRIESHDSLNEAVNRTLAKSAAVCTNFFLTPEEIRRAIEKCELEAEEWDGGVLIFRRVKDYRRTYFYLTDPDSGVNAAIPSPAVLEIVYRDRDEQTKKAVRTFENAGFIPLFQRIRMTRRGDLCEPDSSVRAACADDTDALMHLFCENFHPYAGCVPVQEELDTEIAAGHILTFPGCAGLLHFTESRTGSELRHLAVEESCRKQGIAGALIRSYLSIHGAKKSTVWVQSENEAALRTYEKYGYKPDGMKSAVLIHTK